MLEACKKYFTIGDVSKICAIKPHVLRYWEQEFPQLKPSKRRGNRRYYQKQDIETVRSIQVLLYQQGYTIQGAKHHLRVKPKTPSKSPDTLAKIQSLCLRLEQCLQAYAANP